MKDYSLASNNRSMRSGFLQNANTRILILLSSLFLYLIWISFYYSDFIEIYADQLIYSLSLIGVILFVVIEYLLFKITKNIMSPFAVFIAFVFLFNFGQCALWAFGIHVGNQQFDRGVIYYIIPTTHLQLAKTQLVVLMSMIMLFVGGIILSNKATVNLPIKLNVSEKYTALYKASFAASFIAIPASFAKVIYVYLISHTYNYAALYNGEAEVGLIFHILYLLNFLLLPCLLGLLIGSGYKKSVRHFAYITFAAYAVISLLSGDRGEWILPLFVLLIGDMLYYRQPTLKQILIAIIVALVAISVLGAITDIRGSGVNISSFLSKFSINSNVLFRLISEFGSSMGVSIIVIQDSLMPPFGNTYLMSIPTVFSTSLWNSITGSGYIQAADWLSHDYLNLNFGTDFSLIAESIFNFGVPLTPLVMLVEGVIISKICNIPAHEEANPLGSCLALVCLGFIFKTARSSFWFMLYSITWTIILFLPFYLVAKSINHGKKNKHFMS